MNKSSLSVATNPQTAATLSEGKPGKDDKVNILIVDDQDDKLLALEANLAELKQNIVTARSGREALRQLLLRDFAVILLDVRMPEMDGFETARLIRQRAQSERTPIIFVTSLSQAENEISRGYSIGAVDYVLSPIIPDILRTKVSVFVDLYKRTEEVRRQSERLRQMEEAFHKRQLLEAQDRLDVETKRNRFFTLAIDMLAIANFDGYFLQLNPCWQKALGFSDEELKSKPFLEFIHPEDRTATSTQIGKLKQGESHTIYFENRCLNKNGDIHWLGWMAATFEEEKLIYIFARDITEQKQRMAQLTEINKELESFSYSISHDMRAPLRAMQGFASALADEYRSQLDEKAQKYIDRVVEGARYMDMLLRDILEYSRLTQSQLELSPVMLEPLVDGLIEQSKTDLDQKKAEIEVVRPLLPVVGHLATLRQSLCNLIDNALKFVPPERIPNIRIWTEKRNDTVRIWIQDNGIGIAPEYQEKIFKLFERLHSGEAYPGTGVGLAIVRKALERMKGSVGVESKVDEGSRFWLDLPAVR